MAVVRGVFDDWEAFKGALGSLKEERGHGYTAYAPISLKEVEDLMPDRTSFVRGCSTSCAFLGLATFFIMCVATSLIYSIIVGGKPPISNIPYVIPTYEGTILLGGIGAFIAVLIFACLTRTSLPTDYDTRFSSDSFGIDVDCRPNEREKLTDLLKDAGAVEVYEP